MKGKGLFRLRIDYEDFPVCDSKIKAEDLDKTIARVKKKVL